MISVVLSHRRIRTLRSRSVLRTMARVCVRVLGTHMSGMMDISKGHLSQVFEGIGITLLHRTSRANLLVVIIIVSS